VSADVKETCFSGFWPC